MPRYLALSNGRLLVGLWYFGMFAPTDPKIVATMEAIRRGLWVWSPVGALARYANDSYHRVESQGTSIPGNPWFVCTLWLAQWYIRRAKSEEDLQRAAELLKWAASRALPSGLMAEQIHPFTDEPLSACPLTGSHSTFIVTIREYLAKCRELQCGAKADLQEPAEPNLELVEVGSGKV